ncbi:MAG TPA: hypothetical protein VGW78_00595 [Candidatus Babeliales bacterium]|jgi:hypothetical protein|nr:hypothetical protein [Candidatus Babeliales bacterium]
MIKKYSILFCIVVSVHAFGMDIDKKPSGYNPFQNLAHNTKFYKNFVLKNRFDLQFRQVTIARPIAETMIDAIPLIGAFVAVTKLTDKAIDTLSTNQETKQFISSSLNNALKTNLGYAVIDAIRPAEIGSIHEADQTKFYIMTNKYTYRHWVPHTSPVWKNLFGVSTHIGTDLCIHAAKQTEVGKKIHDTIDKHVDIAPGSIAAIVQFIAIGLVRYRLFG